MIQINNNNRFSIKINRLCISKLHFIKINLNLLIIKTNLLKDKLINKDNPKHH